MTTTPGTTPTTEVGSYFVANYPPFSKWTPAAAEHARAVLLRAPAEPATLGLYAHIPFCRKRCKFCYFRVYTDKNRSERDLYMDALHREWQSYAALPALAGRPLNFVYVGGGTPSSLNEEQITRFGDVLREHWPLDGLREFTFECEPGTLTEQKVRLIRDIGVTRLSLGIESFADDVLKENGRAHLSPEIYNAYAWIRAAGFRQVNVDLIAGMVGETEDAWREGVRRVLELAPDSVTIYQMELPFNTVYSREILEHGAASPVASWAQKRAWAQYAFDALGAAGYATSSAYTMARPSAHSGFVYRDALWHGGDMIGSGVASFGYIQGAHMQNVDKFDPYVERCLAGDLPLHRALITTPRQRLIRELILQLKLGRIEPGPFQAKFGVDIVAEFAEAFADLTQRGMLTRDNGSITLTRDGLLQVDRCLPAFYEREFRDVRYT